MSGVCAGGADSAAIHRTAALGPVDWPGLAAAPTFAMMALLTSATGGDDLSRLCGPAHDLPLLGGMAPMYMLMSAFHSTPWLKLIARRGSAAKRS